MRVTKTFTKLWAFLFLVVAITSSLGSFGHVQAQNLTVDVNLNWIDGTGSCYGTANGQPQSYYNAIAGDAVTLHITNTSSYSLSVGITASGQNVYNTTLSPGGSASPVFTVNSITELQANGSACTSGHGGPGYFAVEAAAGSLTCTIQDNQVWTVSTNYSGISGTATLYRGSTYVQQFTGIKNTTLDVPTQFSTMSTAATYNLYYGSDSSARLLGQVTCPAKTIAASTAPNSTPKAATTPTPAAADATTPPAATTTQPTQPKTSTSKPKATNTSQLATQNASSKQSVARQWFATLLLAGLLAFGIWKLYPTLRKLLKLP